MNKKALILFSGGLDSTTLLALCKKQNYDVHLLSFNYRQRHNIELQKAKDLAKEYNIKNHKIIDIDLRSFGGSALTDDISVPKHEKVEEISDEVPITYVPARNTIFLVYALAYAEVNKIYDIFIGVNAVDYSGYPDCRPEFISSFEKMANFATKMTAENNSAKKIKIHTPLINLSKAEIIKKGLELGVDYSKTISCYDPDEFGKPCGKCDSCLLRQKGFADAGYEDMLTE